MISRRKILTRGGALAATGTLFSQSSWGREPVKVGIISEMSGPFAEFGVQFSTAIKAFQKRHGTSAGGIEIEVISRDVGGPNPDVAKRLAQEFVTRDKVSFLGGFGFSPNASSAAAVATQAKVPMIIMNAQAIGLPLRSPYIIRTSTTAIESAEVIGKWAAQQKLMTAASVVVEYAPGMDAEKAFISSYQKSGGQMLGEPLRIPLGATEYAPYLQRVKDLKPAALFAFVSGGNAGAQFLRSLKERGIQDAGIRVIGTGDVTFEPTLEAAGEAAVGITTAYPYSPMHNSPENNAFVHDFLSAGDGKTMPSIFAVAAYDGLAAIYEVVRRLNGKVDGDKAMALLKGMQIKSPRGPLAIDAETRDPVQTIYIRRTEVRNGRLGNYEI